MVVAEYARGSVPAMSRSALFAMVPVVVVMVVAAGECDRPGGTRRETVSGAGVDWTGRASACCCR